MSTPSISSEKRPNQVSSFADLLQTNALSGNICKLFQSKIVVFQPVLVHTRPLARRDVHRCEQRSAAWAYRWLASSLSLPVSDSCGETGGKLALTSLWVRVSKCCSHYKRPRDGCGNKAAGKIFRAAFHKLVLEPAGKNCLVCAFFSSSISRPEVAVLVFWERTCCLELQGETRSVWSRNQNQACSLQPESPPTPLAFLY